MKLYILSCGAFSIIKVCQVLEKALKNLGVEAKYHYGAFDPRKLEGTVLIAGNPHRWEQRLYNAVKVNPNVDRIIFYLVLEGRILPTFIPMLNYLREKVKDTVIVTPSSYAERRLREAGVKVDAVIPHGLDHVGRPKQRKDNSFLYIAGYLSRKYPRYGVEGIVYAARKHRFKCSIVTTPNNPYIRLLHPYCSIYVDCYRKSDEDICKLYSEHSFYLNLSDSEGFGLTPLEALAHGMIPIIPEYEPLIEHIPYELSIRVPCVNIWYDRWGDWLLMEHHEYRPEDLAKAICKAIEMPKSDFKVLSEEAIEYAKLWLAENIYEMFLEFI